MLPKSAMVKRRTGMRTKKDKSDKADDCSDMSVAARRASSIQDDEVSNTSEFYSGSDDTTENVHAFEISCMEDSNEDEEEGNIIDTEFFDKTSNEDILLSEKIFHEDPPKMKNLPVVEKIAPGIKEIEFGKTYCLRIHQSGFTVELGSKAQPLTPTIGPLPWPSHALHNISPLSSAASITSHHDSYSLTYMPSGYY